MEAVRKVLGLVPATQDEAAEMRMALMAEKEAEVERERLARAHERVQLQVAVSGSSEDNFFVGFSENVSEGGVFIATMAPPAIGEQIDLCMAITEETSLILKGEVRWHRSNAMGETTGCGVRFLAVSPDQERLLARAVSDAAQEPLFYEE